MIIDPIRALSTLSDFLIEWAPIFGAVAALVAIYKFFIKRPALVLQAEVEASSADTAFSVVRATPTLFLSNEGRDFAEDAYLEMELPNWRFQQEDDETNTSAFLDVDTDKTGYLGSPRTLYQVTSNKPVQPRDRYNMFFGGAKFERGRCYEIEYTLSCRSHGPRTGSIEFHVGHNDVEVIHNYPTKRRQYLMAAREIISSKELEEAQLDLLRFDIEWLSENKFRIDTLVKNSGTRRARIANVNFDIFLGDVVPENFYDSISSRIFGLDSNEFWRVTFEGELEEPLSKDDISIDCSLSAQTNHLIDGWEGVHLVDHMADLPTNSNSTIQVCGRVENLNAGTKRTAHVVVKILDRDGVVLSTDGTRIPLEPGEAEDFHLRPKVGREFRDCVDDYDIILMG